MTRFGSAALHLAKRGMAVFPLSPGTKIPMAGSKGFKDATRDLKRVCALWTKHPTANVGIATGAISGVWVLDIDAHHDGEVTLVEIERRHGGLPLTIQVDTPNGGRHLYFRITQGSQGIRNSAGRVGLGIDVRGNGGSIVAPPSVLSDGRQYRWHRNGANSFATSPNWLLEIAIPPPPFQAKKQPLSGDVPRYVLKAVVNELIALERADEGARNDTLNRVAFVLFGFVLAGALPEDWARTELERRASALGLTIREARATIASAHAAAVPRSLSNG
jgi:hypothetical protein